MSAAYGQNEQADKQEERDSGFGDNSDLAWGGTERVGVLGGGGESYGGVGIRKRYLGRGARGGVFASIEAQGEDDGVIRLGSSKNVGAGPTKGELAGGALVIEAGGAEAADVRRVGDSAKVHDGRVPDDGAHAGQNLEEVIEAKFHVHVIPECEIESLSTSLQSLGERRGDRGQAKEERK